MPDRVLLRDIYHLVTGVPGEPPRRGLDLLIEGPVVAAIGKGLSAESARVIGAKNDIEQEKMVITIISGDDMKLKAVLDILQSKLHRRGIDLKALTIGEPESAAGGTVRQKITLQDGVPQEKAREFMLFDLSSCVMPDDRKPMIPDVGFIGAL